MYEVSKLLKEKLLERAALIWETEVEKIQIENGVFSFDGKQMTFTELASRLDETGGPVVASAAVRPNIRVPRLQRTSSMWK